MRRTRRPYASPSQLRQRRQTLSLSLCCVVCTVGGLLLCALATAMHVPADLEPQAAYAASYAILCMFAAGFVTAGAGLVCGACVVFDA